MGAKGRELESWRTRKSRAAVPLCVVEAFGCGRSLLPVGTPLYPTMLLWDPKSMGRGRVPGIDQRYLLRMAWLVLVLTAMLLLRRSKLAGTSWG